jgi:two-component system, OmpR family, response regulator
MSTLSPSSTILIVDDDEPLRKVLSRILSRSGYTVLEATNAVEATTLIQTQSIQLAILDLRLPGRNGAALAADLRRSDDCPPLILFTADLLRLREQPELAAAFDGVLPKPPDLVELRKVVADALMQS